MAITTDRGPERVTPQTAWRQMSVQVFVRSDDEGNPTHVRFQVDNGDHHVASVRQDSDVLRALAEDLLRSTPPRGHCSRWFG